MVLDDEILRQIGALSRSIHSINDIYFKPFDLQRSQFIFVTRICENPGLHLIDLTNMLKVDKATTTKAVQKLIASGFIERQRDEGDKRAWQLFPTAKAAQLYEKIIAEENRNIAICFSDFTAKERTEACRLVGKMSANILAEWKKYKNY